MRSKPKIFSFKEWMAENNRLYYASRSPGKSGDFITSPVVNPAFGYALACQILEMDFKMGHPDPFLLLEFGGGDGKLALDILKGLKEESPDFLLRFYYGICDFPEAIKKCKEQLEINFPEILSRILFLPFTHGDFFRELSKLEAFEGCVLANEFLDALPINLVVKRGSEFKELFLVENENQFEILELPPSPEVVHFIEAFKLDLPDGCFAEINLEMQSWVKGVSSALKRGFALIIDYGGKESELHGERHPFGTLRAFRNHRIVEIATLNLGEGDWTSDIDFSILARVAQKEGFSVTGFSTQGNFLLGLGIAERLPSFRKKELSLVDMKEHLAMKFLFHPEGMGNAFHVLGLHKGVEPSQLAGFRIRSENFQ